MAITKYNPGDARLGASLAMFGFSALAYLKPQFVTSFLVHRRFTMLASLAFGASYLYSAAMYTRGMTVESHKLAAGNGAVATAACLFNGMARRSFAWYALALVPLYLTVEDLLLLQKAWRESTVFQLHKAPNDVQHAHVAKVSGPAPDMPREEKFVVKPAKLSSYEASETLNPPVNAKNRRENKPDLVSGEVNTTPIEMKDEVVAVERVPVHHRKDRL